MIHNHLSVVWQWHSFLYWSGDWAHTIILKPESTTDFESNRTKKVTTCSVLTKRIHTLADKFSRLSQKNVRTFLEHKKEFKHFFKFNSQQTFNKIDTPKVVINITNMFYRIIHRHRAWNKMFWYPRGKRIIYMYINWQNLYTNMTPHFSRTFKDLTQSKKTFKTIKMELQKSWNL